MFFVIPRTNSNYFGKVT